MNTMTGRGGINNIQLRHMNNNSHMYLAPHTSTVRTKLSLSSAPWSIFRHNTVSILDMALIESLQILGKAGVLSK